MFVDVRGWQEPVYQVLRSLTVAAYSDDFIFKSRDVIALDVACVEVAFGIESLVR